MAANEWTYLDRTATIRIAKRANSFPRPEDMLAMKLTTVAAVVAAFGVCGIASAYSGPETPTNISLRIGVALPIEKSLSDVASNFLAFGLEYTLDKSIFGNGETYIALDWWSKSALQTDQRVSPLTINQRFYGAERSGNRRTYTYLGLGVAFTDFGGSDQGVVFRGGFGVELGEATFSEFGVTVGDRAGAVRPNAVTFSVGYRF